MVITNPGHATMRDWVDSIEALRSLDPQAKSTLRAGAQQIRAPKDTVLFRPGDRCKLFPIIVQGVVRVQRIAESGRQLVLYRIDADRERGRLRHLEMH